ncbi:MAG: Cobalt-zinc-cadmium resistance protein CzcA; Cation efflux system protein CusA [uncultured Chthoniobacterales bacterium]|uniref:Cobalt-zinc-cadmium resistance protein CzcA Cation efflux system protein CusA n=1 Tax=uncultured Chthoniobacterales bacterium TaxID=1836801 RepID=A0A6J4HMU0_9BACT|nr:MAG: Cobalt-zinc-cadmium resistance protein CzcA; Cation efflux system protein CusA [uncultured Chthoniobacterales bacterium]
MRKVFSYAIGIAIPLLTALAATSLFGGQEFATGSSYGSRRFTLQQAIDTALRQNPDILRALQEIERTKGLVVEVRGQALPQLEANAVFQQTDPNLRDGGGFSTGGGNGTGATPTPGITPTPGATATPTPGDENGGGSGGGIGTTNNSYNLRFQVSQLVFAGGGVRAQISAANFTKDSSYFALRNTVDQVISLVRTQFYQILLNRALIGVQEQSIRLLESQLQDQQNRFEAGTVPRFNVLQAQVALSNQRPDLFTARNSLRIAELQLARTLGLDFDPARGNSAPLEAIGELAYRPRNMALTQAIAVATERRSFLKQQRASIFNQREQVRAALAGYFPTVRLNGGYEFQSSPFSDNISDVSQGYTWGATGNWAIFDGFQTAGRVKQARAGLQTAQINYDDAVRQVELEVQQAYSNLQQGDELIRSTTETVGQSEEALRLASARLSAGAGTQLEVLSSRVEVTRAQSTRLQALFSYESALAEFDRVIAADTVFHANYQDPLRGRTTRTEKLSAREDAKARGQTTTTTTTTTRETRRARPAQQASPRSR